MVADLDRLRTVRLFRDLAPATLAEVAAATHLRHYRRDMFLFGEGEPLEAFHVVLQGEVRAFRSTPDGHEQTLLLLRAGEVLPVVAFLDGLKYPASAQTVSDSEIGLIRAAELAALARTHPDLAWAFLNSMGRRLLWAQSRIYDLALRSAGGRVASALLDLAREQGRPQADGSLLLEVPLTHRELGQLAGISRETVTRLMSRLRQEGAVRWTDDGRLLVNPASLGRWLGADANGESG